MDDSQKEQFKAWIDNDMFKVYKAGVEKEAKLLRILADQPELDVDKRVYLFAKAQGLDESLGLINTWLD